MNKDNFIDPKELSKNIEALFPSENLKHAFKNLTVKTSPEAVVKLLDDKKRLLVEVLQTGRLPQGILKSRDTVYISSGIDIEYPLCLGARKITLVDPSLSEENSKIALVEKIKSFDPTFKSDRDSTTPLKLSFKFDFGQGQENVEISLEPKIYEKEMAEHHTKGEDYTLPNNVGMILGYRPQDALISDQKVRDNLVVGGVLLVDTNTMAFSDYIEAKRGAADDTKETIDENGVRTKIYRSRGYEYIPLETNKKIGWMKSFLIKIN